MGPHPSLRRGRIHTHTVAEQLMGWKEQIQMPNGKKNNYGALELLSRNMLWLPIQMCVSCPGAEEGVGWGNAASQSFPFTIFSALQPSSPLVKVVRSLVRPLEKC